MEFLTGTAVGKGTEGITVTIRGDESDRARKRDHIQTVRTFLDFHFPGAGSSPLAAPRYSDSRRQRLPIQNLS